MQNLSTDIRFVRSVSRHMISIIFSFLVTSPAHHPITHWKKATTEHQTQKNTILRVHQFSLRWFLRCGSCILVELEFRSVGCCGGRKPENSEKTPSEHDENRQQTLTTYGTEGRNQTRTTIVGSERSQHCAIPAPPICHPLQCDHQSRETSTERTTGWCSSSRKVSHEWLATLWEYNRTNNRNNAP